MYIAHGKTCIRKKAYTWAGAYTLAYLMPATSIEQYYENTVCILCIEI